MPRALAVLALLLLVVGQASSVRAQEELGSISGGITDADTGLPIAGIHVTVSGPVYGSAVTDADGTYTVTNLVPGWYRISAGSGVEQMESDWIGEFFDDRPDWASADQVKLDAGEDVTGIDLELVFGGIITGRVTHAWTGEPIAEVFPIAEVNDPRHGWVQVSFSARTDADGRYRIGGLGGEVRISLWAPNFIEFRSSPMTIDPGTTTTRDIELTPPHGSPFANVYGRACVGIDCLGPETNLTPLAGVTVMAISADGTELGSAVTDTWGWFSLEQLEPGTISVRLADAPPGLEQVLQPAFELGPDESAWDVSLAYQPVPVHFELTAIGPSQSVDAGSDFVIEFTVAVSVSDVAFPVTGTSIQLRIPTAIEVIGYTADGPFDPDTGLWMTDPSPDEPRKLSLILTAHESRRVQISGEVADSDWPDAEAVFGDGQGDDFAAVTMDIVDQVVGPPDLPSSSSTAAISGSVYADEDADGERDVGEPGVEGIEVSLLGRDTSRLVSTDSGGRFEFSAVPAGSYRIEIITDSKRTVTTPDHLLTVTSGTALAGVDIGVALAPSPAPIWLFAAAALLIVGLAGLTGFGIGRRRRESPSPDDGAAWEPVRAGLG